MAISSPFWQGLAVVLIGGLLSSTFLVVTVFPYYYLGGEYLRTHVSRRSALIWIISGVAVALVTSKIASGATLGITILYLVLFPIVFTRLQRRSTKA